MCQQCTTKAESYGEFLPKWFLMRATKEGEEDWPKGHWGLVECNDPTFVFKQTPIIEDVRTLELKFRKAGKTEKQIDKELDDPKYKKVFEQDLVFYEKVREFREKFVLSPEAGHNLFIAATKAGFKRERDGDLAFWLFDYMARWIKKFKPTHHSKSGSKFRKIV